MKERSVLPGQWHGITPLYFGHEECRKGHSFGPAVRDCYLLHYIISGCGKLYKNGRTYPAGQGDIFVILPNEVTTYTASEETPWHYCWIAFRAEQPLPFLSQAVIPAPDCHHIFSALQSCLQEDASESRVFSLTYELLWRLHSSVSGKRAQPVNYAAYAKAHIENTYMMAVSIESIAQMLHIDRRYLTSVFRQAYACTPQQYLMALRLEKAREFLSLGYSVTDTAAMAGFSDLSNFSKKFKQHYGISPQKCK